jgi:hypothetical protein
VASTPATEPLPGVEHVSGSPTTPLPPLPDDAEAPPAPEGPPPSDRPPDEGRPRWLHPPSWVPLASAVGAIAVIGFLLFALAVATLGDASTGTDRPRERGTQAERTAEAPDQPPPDQEAAAGGVLASFDEAVQGLFGTITGGLNSGQISDDVAREVEHKLRDVARELDRGNTDKALEQLEDLRDKIEEFLEKGQITTEERAAAITSAIDRVAETIRASSDEDDD